MTSQQKKTLDQPRRQWLPQLPMKALPNHWFVCIRYVTNPQFLKHTPLSQFEGQFNSSETNYSIPFERWCNRLSFLSNSCFISNRILHKPFKRLFQLICWGWMRPLGYNLSRPWDMVGKVVLNRCNTKPPRNMPKYEYIKYKFHYQSKESTGANHSNKKHPYHVHCLIPCWFHAGFTQQLHFWRVQSSSLTTSDFEDIERLCCSHFPAPNSLP